MCHVGNQAVEGGGIPGHFQSDIEAFPHAEFLLNGFEFRFSRIDGSRRPHFHRQRSSVRIGVGNHDVTGSSVPNDGRSHDSDRPGTRDQHILTKNIEAESCVDRISKRIEDRSHFLINVVSVVPDIRHRQ